MPEIRIICLLTEFVVLSEQEGEHTTTVVVGVQPCRRRSGPEAYPALSRSSPMAVEAAFGRAFDGLMFTAPGSAMAGWAARADQVVVIDGCSMRCHAVKTYMLNK